MEEILIVIFQILAEILLNLISSAFPWEGSAYLGEKEDDNKTILKCVCLFVFGLLLGFLSLHIFPKSLISISSLRIASLIFSPILSGWLSEMIAKLVNRKKDDVWPKRHFWYAFWLSLGYVMVRFIGVQR